MGFDQGSCRGRDSIIIWDAESGENIRTLEGHSEAVYSVDITPDNKKVVSGSRDKTAKIWSMDDGKLLYTFQGHTKCVLSVAVHPVGKGEVGKGEVGVVTLKQKKGFTFS